jgi:hypothetical protein
VSPTQKIQRLAELGYKTYVSHERHIRARCAVGTVRDFKRLGLAPDPTGGRTLVEITRDGVSCALGVAQCSDLDNFNRKIGLEIAVGRAIKDLKDRGPNTTKQLEEAGL